VARIACPALADLPQFNLQQICGKAGHTGSAKPESG